MSTPARPQPRVHARDTAEAPPRPAASALDEIGDLVMAGQRSGYAHLAGRARPTVGQLLTAARSAAHALSRPSLWPRRHGFWQLAPRTVRRGASGRMRVTVVALEPDEFVSLASAPEGRAAGPGADLLYLAHGRAHLVATAPNGALLAVRRLAGGRARALGANSEHQLVNTGTRTAVVVRVTG
ncbi:hypothetical protein DEF23_02075 [Marinitenerispora sediminis]|uniref:Cysteine dioxygenase n=1 Tax=Marinitenerispora sediminis TaxID=1931232 RepID=A0A368T9J7_9ACTN|nr:hypothetical protein DEF28_06590 [Marinitenerispora sediminis]RCV61263.1 hypothetical protein DEF24_04760 [Marinitenerispora sediminis]RCV61535.1 hypothetical protein DEF23_02075 [Marinitenerispora sediminis]